MRRLGTLLVAATLLLSCKDSTSPNDGNPGGSQFNITISGGTKPTYSWAGGGAAHSVSVMRVAAPTTIVWGVAGVLSDVVTSPVTHGTVPTGASATANTEPTLTAGVAYRVSITLKDTKTGFKEFTP